MTNKVDITGKKFGEWSVIEYVGDKKWRCICSCGNIRDVSAYSLKNGLSKTCGDKTKHTYENERAFVDITGQQFGVLKILEYLGNSRWKCQCSCGEYVELLSKNISEHKHLSCIHINKIKYNLKKDSSIGSTVGDLTIIDKKDSDHYICKCKCGKEKVIRKYSLTHPNSELSYKCNHKIIVGQRYNKLLVLERKDENCICQCDCGNKKEVWVGNLLNGTTKSCGCSKAPKYSKDEVANKLNAYIAKNNHKPFIYDIMETLEIGETTAYDYINRYELQEYLNKSFGSHIEKDIYNILCNYCNRIDVHNRKVIKPLELDIYIPEKRIAIEINGSYWHSESHKDKYYHQNKTINCTKQGIRLIHIFEYEWLDEVTRNKIESFIVDLVQSKKQLQARKLKVKEVSNIDTRNLGLYDSDELVSIMTFGKPRFDSNYDFKIIRYCTKSGITIAGGAERLFSNFVNTHKNASIITYSDISKFTGNIYLKLGFNVVKITEPGYVWVPAHNNVISRYKTQKHKLLSQGIGNINQTEDQIMSNLGYYKLYNSGNIKMEYLK